MTKLIAIFYATLILFQSLNMGFEDVSKVSALFEHASFHQDTYGDSFFDFLSEHYGEASVQHEDEHAGHDDLPFKHNHQSCVHANATFTLGGTNLTLFYPPFVEIPFNFHYKESTSLFEKPSVFQPPKLA